MQIQLFNDAFLCFTSDGKKWGLLIDPSNEWKNIGPFLKEKGIELRYILLTKPTFKNAFRVAQIKMETGAKFLSFQTDLIRLRSLPKLADEVNVCGIKTPQVDRFLDGLKEVDLDGNMLTISTDRDTHEYRINSHVIPPRKVETPDEME